MINLLLTSVGRRVELVRQFRQAYQRLGIDGRIVATDIDPLAPALQVVDAPHLVPRVDAPEYISALASICDRESVDLVLPLIDPDIPVLAAHQDELSATGAAVGVVDATAAAMCADKWKGYAFFRELGLAAPDSWLPGDPELGDRVEYPLFIKPRRGSAGQHTYKIDDAKQLAFFADYVPNPIVQRFVAGPEITSDVVCDQEGNVLAIVSRQRIATRGGEAIKAVTVEDSRIQEACLEIARALPACGPITVQCMLDDGVPHFIEINARLGGGVPLAIAAGVDVPGLILSRLAGGSPPAGTLPTYQTGIYMTRCDESFFVTEEEHAGLARHCFRSG